MRLDFNGLVMLLSSKRILFHYGFDDKFSFVVGEHWNSMERRHSQKDKYVVCQLYSALNDSYHNNIAIATMYDQQEA